MPKFIENYKLETIQNLLTDGMEHFVGKQNGSGKIFILKRFKPQPSPAVLQSVQKDAFSLNQQLFQMLTHETLILKNLSHSAIPKCTRMLKTSKSIYFVWEFHPQISLQEHLRKSWLKIEQKIQISAKIIQIIAYLHQKNVVYCGLNLENVKIDEKHQVFLTNFKNALRKEQTPKEFVNQQKMNKQNQFESLIFQDIYNAAIILFEIFQFKKINRKIYVFSSSIEGKLYEELSLILQKKTDAPSLENLKRILNKKVHIRQTQCTQTYDSIPSPTLLKSYVKKSPISRDFNLERSSQTERNSVSCSKVTLQTAFKRAQLLRSEQNISRQSNFNVSSSVINTSISKSRHKTRPSLLQKQIEDSVNEIKKISANRKFINLMLKFLNFIEKSKNLKLIYLIGLKCEFYTGKNQKLIDECSSKYLGRKEMDLLKIVNSENLKTQTFVNRLKQSIQNVVKQYFPSQSIYYETLQKDLMIGKSSQIEQNLSNEIYKYLQKQLFLPHNVTQLPICSSLAESKQEQSFSKSIKPITATKVKRTISIMTPQATKYQEQNYENYKFYYYLSIKLKYGTFERFFDKKNLQNENLDVFKDEYFLPFEKKEIPMDQIAQEVISRVQIFGKKLGP